MSTVYQPMLRLGMSDVDPYATALRSYAGLAAAPYWTFMRDIDEVTQELGPVEWQYRPPFFLMMATCMPRNLRRRLLASIFGARHYT